MITRLTAPILPGLFLAMFLAIACGNGTPTSTPPIITHALTVTVDPPEAAEILQNPTPLNPNLYVRGRTVIINVLPKAGWSVDRWVGPVHDEIGESAKVTMDSNKSVIIRMQRIGTTQATTGGPTAEPTTQITASGPTAEPTTQITASGPGGPASEPIRIFVRSITTDEDTSGAAGSVIFLLEVSDDTGAPVAGADFTGVLVTPSGTKNVGGTTGADGVGKITTPVGPGEFKFEVTGITGPGLLYTPALNAVTQAALAPGWVSFNIVPTSGPDGTNANMVLGASTSNAA